MQFVIPDPKDNKQCSTLVLHNTLNYIQIIEFSFQAEGYGINWVNMQIFDDNGYLVTGEQSLGVWDFKLAKIKKTNPLGPSGKFNAQINTI